MMQSRILAIFFQLVGYVILFYFDWHIALGVFLLHWAINIECKPESMFSKFYKHHMPDIEDVQAEK